jgi:hypothetical protein
LTWEALTTPLLELTGAARQGKSERMLALLQLLVPGFQPDRAASAAPSTARAPVP